MTDDNIKLTRRKILARGAVGAAGAGAGLGTTALFNDEESFEDNSLTAGELDLKIDWEEHYSFPQIYGNDDPTLDAQGEPLNVTQTEPSDTSSYVGLPDPESPVIWVHEDDLDDYMSNTAIEAFPDPDNDGEQEIETGEFSYAPCDQGADLPDDLGTFAPDEEVAARTQNDDTTDDNGDPKPLINLIDVKPGDFGEFTFSFHLCDNPGYVWLQAANVTQGGGANPDPEQDAEGDADNDANLAENIRTVWWYDDDGNNVVDDGKTCDVMLTLDFSGSMLYDQFGGVVSDESITINGDTYDETTKIDLVEKGTRQFVQFLQATSADVNVGVAYFDGSADEKARFGTLQPLTSNLGDVESVLTGLRQTVANIVTGDPNPSDDDGNPDPFSNASGIAEGTYIHEGVDEAQRKLNDNARGDAEYKNIVLSDGNSFEGTDNNPSEGTPQAAADDARANLTDNPSTTVYGIAVATGGNGESTLQSMSGAAGDTAGNDPSFFFDVDDPLDLPTIFGSLAAEIAPEKVFRRGTLESDLEALDPDQGGARIPLDGNPTTVFDEFNDDPTDPDRDCFPAGDTHYIGFGWWLPDTVGNEVQGDSVSFDLGFYTEQCRNNDGTGES